METHKSIRFTEAFTLNCYGYFKFRKIFFMPGFKLNYLESNAKKLLI